MSYFQILACNGTLENCCSDPALAGIMSAFSGILDLIQIVVPIILIIWSTYGFIRLISNPEEKNGIKNLINKFLAAMFVFFVPVVVNAVMGIMPNSFNLSSCWRQAKVAREVNRSSGNSYVSPYDGGTPSPIMISPDDYEKGNPRGGGSGSSGGSGKGSATGKSIVQYAKSFVGKPYVWGGTWNGELPYTPTDCSGFVQGVFNHHGISLGRDTASQWADKSKYTLVNESDIRAGDLIMYSGHVGILTGNGTEIVHAKGSRWGVVVDPDYRQCSSHSILGIMRINGVN